MDINVTLFGEMLTFAVLVWVMMKYIWPPLMKVIQERQEKIAEGLEAAEKSKHELELTKASISEQLNIAKTQAVAVLDRAHQQAEVFIEESRILVQAERAKMLVQAKLDLEREVNRIKRELQQQTADLVIAATEKILRQKIDSATQKKLIDELISSV